MDVLAVIPAYNESASIERVIDQLRAANVFSGIVGVNDGSTDDTCCKMEFALAWETGNRVIDLQTNRGKGGAIKAAIAHCFEDCDLLAFFDGDMHMSVADIRSFIGRASTASKDKFTKASFVRPHGPGRVTTLTARPLLRVLYPQLAELAEPIGGIYAAPSAWLKGNCHLWPDDFGIDVAMLISAHQTIGIAETSFGFVGHNGKDDVGHLYPMAVQVASAILRTKGITE